MTEIDDSSRVQSPMRRVIGNFGFLMRGRGIAAVMTLGATALAARSLGSAEFGRVILILTYALLIRGLLKIRLFEAIVKFGVPSHDAGDHTTLRRLVHACKRVDHLTSIIATVAAVLMAPFIGPLINLDQEHVVMLTGYSLVLLTSGVGTANGLLRLFDQFDVLGRQMTISPAIRLVGLGLACWFDSPVIVFICIFALASVSEDLYLKWSGRREYLKRVGEPVKGENVGDAKLAEFPGLGRFLWITYWQSNVDLVPRQVSIMLAGYLLGPAEAGLLRLARQFSTLLSKPATLLRQVVFLDLTRSWNEKSDNFKLVTYRTALLGGALGLCFVAAGYFFGDDFLRALVGEEFTAAAPVLTLMLLAATFDLVASSLRSAAYAMGKAGNVLRIYAVSAAIYLAFFLAFTSWLGLIGAGIAACIGTVVPPIAMSVLIHKSEHKSDVDSD
ncbi:MAG: O-antigen/teichoic acid export membrane protein [Planctomycetota bacterium]|jgi:O-antigen/teichoic acid export membrane protein